MPKQARPSAYRKSYGKEGNYVVVDADVKVMKEAEKDQMKKLNNRLVNYIEKVHDLEIANKILAAENAKLRKMKDTPETDIAAIYDDELDRLRQKVEQLQTANAELEIQKDNLSYDLQEADEKLEETKEENKELEKEVKSLRKDVDDATIERVSLESKIENQQESMELMKQVHEAEMENLRRQIQPVEAPVLNSEQSSILPDLNDAIEKVRRQYEQFNAKSIEDLDNFYKEKVDSLNKQLRAAQAEVRELRADNNEKKKRIHQLEMEIEALRNKNDTLERSIEHLEDRLGREAAENQDLLKQLHDELDSTKQDLGKYLKDYQALNSLKLSLEQEIAIYHKLLTGEESRISEIDTQVVVASRGRTRSRSSSVSSKESRSRSRDSSRKSSRQSSRKSSPERDTGKIVEEMMEKSEPVEGTPPKKEAGTPSKPLSRSSSSSSSSDSSDSDDAGEVNGRKLSSDHDVSKRDYCVSTDPNKPQVTPLDNGAVSKSSKRLSSSSTSSSDSSRHESEIMSGKQDSEKHHENEQLDVAEPGDDVKQEEDEDKPDDDADAEESDGVQDSTALSNGNTTPPKSPKQLSRSGSSSSSSSSDSSDDDENTKIVVQETNDAAASIDKKSDEDLPINGSIESETANSKDLSDPGHTTAIGDISPEKDDENSEVQQSSDDWMSKKREWTLADLSDSVQRQNTGNSIPLPDGCMATSKEQDAYALNEDVVEVSLDKVEVICSEEPSGDKKSKTKVITKEQGVISVSWKVKGGTVRPVNPFQPADDAERLRKAMKGIGTDESVIIEILSKRSKIQRQVIAKVYLEKYNDDLLDDLESEVGGNLKAVCQHLMWKRSELDAHAIRKAIKGFGTDEAVLIEILCTQSGREINEIKSDYSRIFEGRDLVKDVEKETSGQFKTFLLAILKANRPPDSGTVVSNVAEEDAKTLFDMGVKNWKPSDPTFLHIFTQRSFQHLWYVFKQCWVKLTTENLMDVVDKECKGDLKKGLQTLIRFSTCIPPSYYAIQIRDVMSGKGTEDKRLIYIITTRSEVDLIDVKEEYSRMYDQDLSKSISDETSGDYKKIMLALVEE